MLMDLDDDDESSVVPRPRLSVRERTSPLFKYSNAELYERFRFDREGLESITRLVTSHLERATRRNLALEPELQVCLALRFFATGAFQNIIGDDFQVSKDSVRRSIFGVADALLCHADHFIKFPTPEAMDEERTRFFRMGRFPGVWGCIDGTHIPIQAPSEDEENYVNRKGWHSINVQAICDSEGKFYDVVVKWPGATHDARILRSSAVFRKFEDGELTGVILGDSGYPNRPWLLTPFASPTTPPEHRYNKALCKTRWIIEQTFGRWKRRFFCLRSCLRYSPRKCCKIIAASAILHNIALSQRLPHVTESDNPTPPFDDLDSEIPLPLAEGDRIEGAAFRQHVVSACFT